MKRNMCPCCGYKGLLEPAYKALPEDVLVRRLLPPYSQYFGDPSYEVCNCCGYEFGNDDEPGTGQAQSFEAYLDEWIRHGCLWFSAEEKPENWSLSNQLFGKKILSLPSRARIFDASAIGTAYANAVVVWEADGVKAIPQGASDDCFISMVEYRASAA